MGKGRGRSGAEPLGDQYGEYGQSQDRSEFVPSKSFRGGGSAGGPSGAQASVTYHRQIPKFLQPYAHLIDKKKNPFRAPQTDEAEEALQAGTDECEIEAISRALDENPDAAAQVGEDLIKKVEAAREKDAGNTCYAEGDYMKAVTHFSRCIELDPRNEVYFSNRSAAFSELKDYESAVRDAKSTIRLKPRWVKGWARLACAHFGLEEFSEAKDAYKEAMDLEPDNETLQEGFFKADTMERKWMREHVHKFKRKTIPTGDQKRSRKQPKKAADKPRVKLSFED